MSHRFLGDHKGRRDRRGHLLVTVEPILCAKCRATPDDPECLCPPLPAVPATSEPEGQAGGTVDNGKAADDEGSEGGTSVDGE